MPLVRIDVLSERNADKLTAIGDAVHQAMVEIIKIPEGDQFQILNSHPAGRVRYDPEFLGVQRDDGIVFVAITLRAGRTEERKFALYRRIVELVEEKAGVSPGNVFISLTENEPRDWSLGDGEAQLVTGDTKW